MRSYEGNIKRIFQKGSKSKIQNKSVDNYIKEITFIINDCIENDCIDGPLKDF